MIRLIWILLIAVSGFLATPLCLAHGNAEREIATATVHAQMAMVAAKKSTAIMHMHHVINCLVGPKSPRFDARAGNPCKGMGTGALRDIGAAPAVRMKLVQALVRAERAVQARRFSTVRHDAAMVTRALKAASRVAG